ncbi:MAG: polysaccharide biosynthesis protein [Clostridiales bacterium]|nr:polysaccharide biosynthesis protein [Clostridiales bacterium]
METRKSASPRIISGVIVLMISNIVVKLLGLLCKIPLHDLLQDQGMGYFNIAYNIFTTLYMVSTAGLPTAVTIMISDTPAGSSRRRQVERIFRVALAVFFVLGIIGTSIMLFFAKPLAALMGSDASYLCIMAISPTLFFICMSSAIRGYFQGHQNMIPTAVSEITEAIGKFAIGIVLAKYAISRGESIERVAAYAIAGITIGVATGMIFLIISKILYNSDKNAAIETKEGSVSSRSRLDILKQLAKIALPITISAVALNLTGIIDTFSIINCMKLYTEEQLAEIAYGNYSTLAVTMSHLPSAFITPIASSLTPALTAALLAIKTAKDEAERREKELRASKVMQSCLKFAAIISIPCALGLSILAKPILSLLFKNQESVNAAAPLLSILAISVFFTAMLTITTSILQAHKLQHKPIISMCGGIVVKIILNVLLISNPSIGIYGAPIGTLVSYFVMASINFYFVIKYVGIHVSIIKNFGKPFLSSLAASLLTVLVYVLVETQTGHAAVATVLSILITVLVYFILLFLLHTFTKNDILLLPKGESIYRVLCKMKLMK